MAPPQGPLIPPDSDFSECYSTKIQTPNIMLETQTLTSDNIEEITANCKQGSILFTNYGTMTIGSYISAKFNNTYVNANSIILVSILNVDQTYTLTANTHTIESGSFYVQVANIGVGSITDEPFKVAFFIIN